MSSSPQTALPGIDVLLVGMSDAQEYWTRVALTEAEIIHTITSFGSAVNAVSRLAETSIRYDVAILNVKLPLLEIAEAVTALKALPATAAARVIVMVVDPSELKAVPSGCDAMLMPGRPEDFRNLFMWR